MGVRAIRDSWPASVIMKMLQWAEATLVSLKDAREAQSEIYSAVV